MPSTSRDKKKKLGILVILCCSGVFQTALSNDTAFGGSGALPIPISQPDIKMVNEVIIISGSNLNNPEMNGSWHFSCDFTFANMLKKSLSVSMGFPFPVNDGESAVALPKGEKSRIGQSLVYNFLVQVDAKKVDARKEKIAANQDKGLNYEEAYLWETTFAPLQEVKIHHDYITGATYDVMGYHWVEYVLKTGALWRDKTIGHTQLEVIPNTPTRLRSEIDETKTYLKPTPAGMEVVGTGKGRKYVWDLPNFQPKEDVSLCLYTGRSYVRYAIVYDLLNSDDVSNKLASLNSQELRILRNTIYAQYGRQFKSPDLQKYFDRQWWYEPNSGYSDSDLNEEDKNLLKLINAL